MAARGATGATGVNPRGAYNNVTAYAITDAVLYQGSTWVAVAATTGNAPPTLPTTSNSWWQLLAQKGVDGLGTGDVVGPSSAVDNRIAVFDGTTGKLIKDGGKLVGDVVTGPASSVTGNLPAFGGTSGKTVVDSGVPAKTADKRNRIVNPCMRIGQENGTSAIATGYLADQWNMIGNGLSLQGALSVQRSPSRSPNVILHSYQVAKASLAAGDYGQIYQSIEGIRTSDFGWGTAQAIPVVARFSMKSDTVGTYTMSLTDSTGGYSFLFAAVVDAVDVWKTFTVPIPPPPAGTWPVGTDSSMALHFCTACGTTYGGGTAGWQASNKLAIAGQVNMAVAANKNIIIADVGLYADPQNTGLAPPFEVPDFSTDLLECQRYYEVVGMTLSHSADGAYPYTNTAFWKASKRVAPTLAVVAGSLNGGAVSVIAHSPNAGIRQTAFAAGAIDAGFSGNARMS